VVIDHQFCILLMPGACGSMPRWSHGSRPLARHPWLGRLRAVGLALLTVVAVAVPVLVVPRLGRAVLRPIQLNEDTGNAAAPSAASQPHDVEAFLLLVQNTIAPLQKQVEDGQIVPKFGAKAANIVSSLAESVCAEQSELVRAVDSMLHTLFLRQLALLRQQITAKFDKVAHPLEAVSQADQQFIAQAQELRRPDSDWSYEHERYALRAVLEGSVRRDEALEEQRMLSTQTIQSTVEIINKLQSQMENLQQKVQAMRAGSPWFFSSSYRIPHTPFQLIGRYQQGRANIELSLNPDKDPANSDVGFVEGLRPANLGVSLNLGM